MLTHRSYQETKNSSRLTIKIDGEHFPLKKFQSALSNFHIVLSEVDKETSLDGSKSVEWSVTNIKQGSLIITAEASLISDEINPQRRDEIISIFKDGMQIIEKRPEQPFGFSPRALRSVKQLSELIDPKDFAEITFRSGNWAVSLNEKISINIDGLTKDTYTYYDSIEGQLLSINISRGIKIGIRDNVNKNIVRCYFPEELLSEAKNSLGEKVLVFGLIKQYWHGHKISIRVQKIKIIPKPTKFFSLSDITKVMKGEDD